MPSTILLGVKQFGSISTLRRQKITTSGLKAIVNASQTCTRSTNEPRNSKNYENRRMWRRRKKSASEQVKNVRKNESRNNCVRKKINGNASDAKKKRNGPGRIENNGKQRRKLRKSDEHWKKRFNRSKRRKSKLQNGSILVLLHHFHSTRIQRYLLRPCRTSSLRLSLNRLPRCIPFQRHRR